MNRFITRTLSLLLAGGAILSLLGCTPAGRPQDSHSVWSTYNTTKVIRHSGRNDSYTKMDGKLSVQMMRGEYEGAQLIITAARDCTYLLTAGVLQSEAGAVFPAENIQIYHQKYQTIEANTNGDKAFQAGDSIPDMLLPMDLAAAYEENKIAAGDNQGITVEFHSENVPAGIYTGSFTLDLDGQTQEIPVSVEVWDIEYEGRREFQSCFVLYRDELFVSEFRCDDELVDTYVDKLLRYKVNTYVMQDYTPELFVEKTRVLFENSSYNSIAIPYRFPWDYATYENGALTEAAQQAIDYIKALAKASTPEKNYIEYAYIYLGFLDEADVIDGRQEPSEAFLKDGGDYRQLLNSAVAQLDLEGWFAAQSPEFAAQVKAAVLNLPPVFTNVNYVPQWVGTLNAAFCPYLSVFNDTATLNRYQEAAAQRSDGKLWLYTCCGPVDPYPTFHIDDGTLDKRVCGWMLKANSISGYLYYKVNNYAYLASAPEEEYIDVYATPARYYDVNGDGFLLYPGRYYGSDEPFATVRLAAYRDGMDEYDMLCIYEALLQEYAQKQGIADFDFTVYVEDLYRSLFHGMVATQDAGALYEAREELAKRILALKQDGILRFDPASSRQVNLTGYAGGKQEVVIRSEYKDKGEEIGSKTKMFRPCYTVPVEGLAEAKALHFSYENTGSEDIAMEIQLVVDGEKVTVDTSFCGAGRSRQVRVQLPDIALQEVTELLLVFDNVQVDEQGQSVLMPDRAFTLSDLLAVQ